MMKLVVVLLTGFALTACVPTEEQRQKLREQIATTCTNYGFKKGTDAFSNCLMQVDAQQANARQRHAMQVANDVSDINAMNRTTYCTSTPIGGRVATTCN